MIHFISRYYAQVQNKKPLALDYRKYKQSILDQWKLFGTSEQRKYRWPPQAATIPEASSTVRDTFDRLFKACPNISEITVNHKHTLRPNAGLSNVAFLRSAVVPHGGHSDVVTQVVEELLPAADDANLMIRHLAIAGASPFWMRIGKPNDKFPTIMPKCFKVLQHIQRLCLVFNGADAFEDEDDPGVDNGFYFITDTFADGVLICWLEECLAVQELDLVMPIAPSPGMRVDLKHVLGNLHLENLTRLRLSVFEARAEDVKQCLLRHKDTLQEFVIETAHLTSGDWPACNSAIAGRFSCLRHATIQGFLTSDSDNGFETERMFCLLTRPRASILQAELERFILGSRASMPPWPSVALSDEDDWPDMVSQCPEDHDDDDEGEDETDDSDADEGIPEDGESHCADDHDTDDASEESDDSDYHSDVDGPRNRDD